MCRWISKSGPQVTSSFSGDFDEAEFDHQLLEGLEFGLLLVDLPLQLGVHLGQLVQLFVDQLLLVLLLVTEKNMARIRPGANFMSQKLRVKFPLVEFLRALIETLPFFSLGVNSAQLKSNCFLKI